MPTVVVRPMRADEGRLFLELQARSVRGLAADHYPPAVIDVWAHPQTDDSLRRFLENRDNEIRLIAALDGEPAGLGVLVVASSELRACYVAPEAARCGVGTAIVRAIERLAKEHGLERLELVSSMNAEAFYASLGYQSEGRTEHRLSRGQPMDAVKMAKQL